MASVISNQSFFDICLQESGSLFRVYDIAAKNEMSVTQPMNPGVIVKTETDNKEIADYFTERNKRITTASHTNEGVYNEYGLPLTFPII